MLFSVEQGVVGLKNKKKRGKNLKEYIFSQIELFDFTSNVFQQRFTLFNAFLFLFFIIFLDQATNARQLIE